MTRKQYAVHTFRDGPVRLQDQLDHIAAEGGDRPRATKGLR
jgi:hypothetical protein